ncbi:MAG: hypothetical protein AAF570_25560, partial [Bacteroidota bacterium]
MDTLNAIYELITQLSEGQPTTAHDKSTFIFLAILAAAGIVVAWWQEANRRARAKAIAAAIEKVDEEYRAKHDTLSREVAFAREAMGRIDERVK